MNRKSLFVMGISLILMISFSTNIPWVVDAQDRSLVVQDLVPITIDNAGKLTELFSIEHNSQPLDLVFGSSTNVLASANLDGSILLWTPESGTTSLSGHTDAVTGAVFTDHDNRLISGSWDGSLRLWDVKSRQNRDVFQSSFPIWSIAFAPDEQRIAYGDNEGIIYLRSADLRYGEGQLQTDFNWTVMSLAFSPDEKTLAACYANGLWLWDMQLRDVFDILSDHATNHVMFSPDGNRIVSEDGQVHTWDLQTHSETVSQPEQGANIPSAQDVAITPDGRLIASGSYDKFVQIWDNKTGHLLANLQGNADLVSTVAFNYNGTLLASGDLTGKIRIWGVPIDNSSREQPS